MFRSFRTLTPSLIIPVLLTFACGGNAGGANDGELEAGGAAGNDESGAAGANERGEGGRAEPSTPSKGGRAGGGGSSGTAGESDAGSDGGDGASGASGEAGSNGGEAPTCVSSDAPDDDFVDSNCDGIDGELTRAVFVSPDGIDGAAGTLDAPLRNIDAAIELASTTGRDVYVCNGTFTEAVTVTKPVALYGGYDCINDGRRTKDRAVVAPDRGVALSVQNVTDAVRIERVAFRSADAVLPGESSQAGSIVGSNDVKLSRVEFSAGKGADGTPGALGADATRAPPPPGAPGGNAPTTACNADAMTPACQATPSKGFDERLAHSCEQDGIVKAQVGGPGGVGANVWLALGRPALFNAGTVTVKGGAGNVGSYFNGIMWLSHQPILASQHGAAGKDGADATRGFGSVSAGVYVADNWGWNGKDGEAGYPGNGGWGGSSWTEGGDLGGTRFYVGAGGAQGGVGGCGGKGAKGGGGGGGSIALVVESSGVSLELSQLVTASGGAGRDGNPGGSGQRGGVSGAVGTSAPGAAKPTAGGPGGTGGNGGAAGAGAGGPSIGVVFVGAAPAMSETTYVIGTGGPGGISVRAPNIVNGISADFYDATAAL